MTWQRIWHVSGSARVASRTFSGWSSRPTRTRSSRRSSAGPRAAVGGRQRRGRRARLAGRPADQLHARAGRDVPGPAGQLPSRPRAGHRGRRPGRRRRTGQRAGRRARAVPAAGGGRAAGGRDGQDRRVRPVGQALRRRERILAAPKGPNDATEPADFEPFGAFAEPAQAQAHARLTGTVLKAERRFSWLTGHPFTVAITRTAGFEVDLCLARDEHPTVPAPGAIVTGVVSLSISMEHLTG